MATCRQKRFCLVHEIAPFMLLLQWNTELTSTHVSYVDINLSTLFLLALKLDQKHYSIARSVPT